MDEMEARRWADALHCPWCHRGPWRVLAAHTFQAHGVRARELRDRLGYPRRVSLCSPDVSASRSKKAKDERTLEHVDLETRLAGRRRAETTVAESRRRTTFAASSDIHQKSLATRLQNYAPPSTCKSGRHSWVPENLVTQQPEGRRTCRLCRDENVARHAALISARRASLRQARRCERCGAQFATVRTAQRYCTPLCRRRARTARDAGLA